MDDNRIQELINLNWDRMSLILETELPVKRKKRRYVWLLILFLTSFISGLGTLISTISEKPTPPLDIHHINKLGYQNNKKDLIALNNKVTSYNDIGRNHESYFTKISSENKYTNSNSKIKYSESTMISEDFTKSIPFELINSVYLYENENSSFNFEMNKRLILNFPYLNKKIYLASNRNPISISPEQISPQVNLPFIMYYGISGSALFDGLRTPSAYEGGIFTQIPISRKLFFEANINYIKYNQYQIFQHNGIISDGNSSSTIASASSPSKFVYINNSGSLSNNELNALNEILLYSSIRSISYFKAGFNLGCHVSRKISIIPGISIQNLLKSSYEINAQNQTLYKAINNMELSQDILKSGDNLLRKWITTAELALDYKITSNLGIRSSVHMASLKYNSAIDQIRLKDLNTPPNIISMSLIPETKPEKGNIFFQFGLNYRLY